MAYVWGSRSYAVPADVVGETIEEIVAEQGACPPGELVERARPVSSPLHRLFTWDDGQAAEHWRTHEARQVIRCVHIVSDDAKEGTEKPGPPAFVSVNHRPDASGIPGYQPISVIQASPDLAREAQRDALRSLIGLQRRYSHLAELKPVWDAVRHIEASMNRLDDVAA